MLLNFPTRGLTVAPHRAATRSPRYPGHRIASSAPIRRLARCAAQAPAADTFNGPRTPEGAVDLQFTLSKEVCFGQHVLLAGDVEELGSWDLSRASRMEWTEGRNGEHQWIATVPLPAGSAVEYKFVVAGLNRPPVWESCPNRSLIVEPSAAHLFGCWEQNLQPMDAQAAAAATFEVAAVVEPEEEAAEASSPVEAQPSDAEPTAIQAAPKQEQKEEEQQAATSSAVEGILTPAEPEAVATGAGEETAPVPQQLKQQGIKISAQAEAAVTEIIERAQAAAAPVPAKPAAAEPQMTAAGAPTKGGNVKGKAARGNRGRRTKSGPSKKQ